MYGTTFPSKVSQGGLPVHTDLGAEGRHMSELMSQKILCYYVYSVAEDTLSSGILCRRVHLLCVSWRPLRVHVSMDVVPYILRREWA